MGIFRGALGGENGRCTPRENHLHWEPDKFGDERRDVRDRRREPMRQEYSFPVYPAELDEPRSERVEPCLRRFTGLQKPNTGNRR